MKKKVILNPGIEVKYEQMHFSGDTAPSGAGEGIGGVLQNLFNDSSEEAKLLAFQLELLKNQLNNTYKPIYL